MKVVINNDWGGFSLSREAYEKLGLEWDGYGYDYSEDRANPLLVKVVEELGKDAWGDCATLKVVEIPDDIKWTIEKYDGLEHIAEEHRTWE